MVQPLVLHDQEFNELVQAARTLCETASARAVFMVDKDGQLLATAGDDQALDALSIASLTAGNVAATDGLARLLGENEFGELYHQESLTIFTFHLPVSAYSWWLSSTIDPPLDW